MSPRHPLLDAVDAERRRQRRRIALAFGIGLAVGYPIGYLLTRTAG